ncbi:hypothetical protein LTS18_012776, partial [Coniosporium uncinatum]
GTKRTSNAISHSSDDKENEGVDIDVPKKRAKTSSAMPANARTERAASRKEVPPTVLSPKSHNSRTLPRSPLKAPSSPAKSFLARPVSPLKPATTATTATVSMAAMGPEKPKASGRVASRQAQAVTTASTATGIGRGKRVPGTTAPLSQSNRGRGRALSGSSNASDTSAGTTIVMKKATPAKKKGVVGTMKGMASAAGKKVTGAKKDVTSSTATTGGRVLRARK